MKKVSIIVISYNEKVYLQRALDSCTCQTWDNTEIIIGDDGSSDGSIEFIKDFCQKHEKFEVKYFVMDRTTDKQENIIPSIRVSNLLKKGFEIAKGDYLVILSGDDYFIDNAKIEKAVNFLSQNPEYSCYITGFKYSRAYEEDSWPIFQSKALYWSGGYLHISCFVFCRPQKLLDRFCDDTDLVYSLLPGGKWKFKNELSFVYYQRNDGIMGQSKENDLIIVDVMLYQDILNGERYYNHSTRARFFGPVVQLFRRRQILGRPEYRKYLENSKQYGHDLLGIFADYDKSSLFGKTQVLMNIANMWLDFTFFKVIRKIIYYLWKAYQLLFLKEKS